MSISKIHRKAAFSVKIVWALIPPFHVYSMIFRSSSSILRYPKKKTIKALTLATHHPPHILVIWQETVLIFLCVSPWLKKTRISHWKMVWLCTISPIHKESHLKISQSRGIEVFGLSFGQFPSHPKKCWVWAVGDLIWTGNIWWIA